MVFPREASVADISGAFRRHRAVGLCAGASCHHTLAEHLSEPAGALRVEQAVVWLLGGRAAWWQVFLLALPAAALLAFLSWHLVERPALRLKPRRRVSPAALRREAGAEVRPAASIASIRQT